MWKPPGIARLAALPTWHLRAQQQARRNALVASTALAGRRKERDEAEAFLERHLAARAGGRSRTA